MRLKGHTRFESIHSTRMAGFLQTLYVVPAAILIGLVFLLPLIQSLVFSLQKSAGVAGTKGWNGLGNYSDELHSTTFWQVGLQTVVWTIAVLLLTILISLVLAVLLEDPFPGRKYFRVLLMTPWAVSMAVSAVVWSFALQPNGLVDATLRAVRLQQLIRPWLANTPTATVMLILVGTWVSVPFNTVLISAGMSAIPPAIYEAADLESDKRIGRVWFITLPLIRPVLRVAVLAGFISIFNSFPIIYIMTGGGPVYKTHIYATYLYDLAFINLDMGHASAIAVMVSLILLATSLLYVRVVSDRGYRKGSYEQVLGSSTEDPIQVLQVA